MYLNNFFLANKHNIGSSGEILAMQVVAKPHTVDERSYYSFRGCVLALDGRHIAAALFFGVYVGHSLNSRLLFPHQFDKITYGENPFPLLTRVRLMERSGNN